MAGTFFGISIAQSALAAQRRAMDVLGYNIANANDPTYKRQRMVLVEGSVLAASQEASPIGSSAFGTGVGSGDIERVREPLIENRLRMATQSGANWNYRQKTMSQLEATIGEPSDTGLQNDLDNFWASWQKVATSPESIPIRSALLEDTSALCQRMNYTYMQMGDMIKDLNLAAIDRVKQVNLMANEIGSLNNEIGALSSGAMPVNDLLNRRDALVQELSKQVAINQHGEGKDSFIISIGGSVLVQGTKISELKTSPDISGNQQILWVRDSEPIALTGGELKAITDIRDTTIPGYLRQMDEMASQLVKTVNEQNRAGVGLNGMAGGDFFEDFPTGTTAANISLHFDGNPPNPMNPGVVGHPERIAASIADDPTTLTINESGVGSGGNAQLIASLKDKPTSTGFTINQIFRALIGDIGGSAATASTQAKAAELSVEQFVTQQQAVSGVSLDEEMTNMIKFQQAYNSAAKVLTAMDEMLQALVNIS
ncbi:MAG: flagellar hook-associated protein FlgK [Armatimonadetes bacterium]|nr:flagellar hook-associated protein FlgK [Armatimonadota bacterium]